jgi:hypothetical protein
MDNQEPNQPIDQILNDNTYSPNPTAGVPAPPTPEATPGQSPDSAETKQPKNNKKRILIISLAAGSVLLIAALAFVLFFNNKAIDYTAIYNSTRTLRSNTKDIIEGEFSSYVPNIGEFLPDCTHDRDGIDFNETVAKFNKEYDIFIKGMTEMNKLADSNDNNIVKKYNDLKPIADQVQSILERDHAALAEFKVYADAVKNLDQAKIKDGDYQQAIAAADKLAGSKDKIIASIGQNTLKMVAPAFDFNRNLGCYEFFSFVYNDAVDFFADFNLSEQEQTDFYNKLQALVDAVHEQVK